VYSRLRRRALVLFLVLPITVAAAQQRPVFQATVAQVRVDVIVTDANGNFLPDLSQEDFVVYEDGEPQEILSIQLVDLSEGTVLRLGQPAPQPAAGGEAAAGPPAKTDPPRIAVPPPAADDAAAAPSADVVATDLGAVIYIIDGPGMDETVKDRFTIAWSSLLDQTESLSVPHAAYMISGVGRIEELSPLTMDMGQMREAVRKLEDEPLLDHSLQRRLVDFYNLMSGEGSLGVGIEEEGGLAGASPQGNEPATMMAAQAQAEEQQELARSLYTLEILTSFCDALAARGGRTALVWVTTGVKTTEGGPFTILASNEERTSMTLGKPDPRAMEQMEKLQQAANGSGVSIYAIDPTPINQVRGIAIDAGIQTTSEAAFNSGRSGGAQLGSVEMQFAITSLRDGLVEAAMETGGRAIIGATDLAEAVHTIEQDTRRFYLVTYAAPPPEGDGEYHEIRVEVRRPGASVRAREGYVDLAGEEAQQRLVVAALALPGTVTGLPVHAEAFRVWGWGAKRTLVLATSIEAWKVNTGVRDDGSLGAALRIHITVTDEDGNLIENADDDLSARARAQEAARQAQAATGGGSAAPPGAGLVVYRNGWVLDPGSYDIHIALLDEIAGEIGATRLEVEIPDVEEGWRTSDLMLVTTDSSIYAYPIPAGRFVAGQEIGAYIEIKDGVQPVMGGRILEPPKPGGEGTGDTVARTLRVMPGARLRTKGPGTHSGSLQLPSDLAPGKYTLEVVISDPDAGMERTLLHPIEVLLPRAAGGEIAIGSG
jgi:VWFA-related protein